MDRNILYCIIALIIAVPVSASPVFDAWVTNKENITIEGIRYGALADANALILTELNGSSKIVLLVNTTRQYKALTFRDDGSKTTLDDMYQQYNISRLHSAEADKFMHKLVVTRASESMTITRTIQPSSPCIFDTMKVLISIKNNGDKQLRSVLYEETLPGFIIPGSYKDPETKNEITFADARQIRWKMNLEAGETRTLDATYTLASLTSSDAALRPAKASYNGLDGTAVVNIPETAFTVAQPLKITLAGNAIAKYKDAYALAVGLTNIHSTDDLSNVACYLTLPDGMVFAEQPDSFERLSPGKYLYKRPKLKKGETATLDLDLSSSFINPKTISMNCISQIRGTTLEKEANLNISSDFAEPILDLVVNSSSQNIRGGDEVSISFKVQNPNAKQIDSCFVEISSEHFRTRKYLYEWLQGKQNGLMGIIENRFSVILPSVDTAESSEIRLNFTANSGTSDAKEFSVSKPFNVQPGLASVLFDASMEVINASEDEFEIKINLKKLQDAKVDALEMTAESSIDDQAIIAGAEDLAALTSTGAERSFSLILLRDSSLLLNDIDVKVAASVEGRLVEQQEKFSINGTTIIELLEDPGLSNENETLGQIEGEAETVGDPFQFETSDDYWNINSFYITMAILGIGGLFFIVWLFSSFSKGKQTNKYGNMQDIGMNNPDKILPAIKNKPKNGLELYEESSAPNEDYLDQMMNKK